MGFESLAMDVMPAEIVIAQLSTVFEHVGRTLRVHYLPTGTPMESLLVVVTDITDELRRAELDRLQGEVLALVERERVDPVGVIELLAAVDELVERIARGDSSTVELLGDVHTLKGIASLFGIASVAEVCEAAETEAADDGDRPSSRMITRLTRSWQAVRDRARPFLELPGHDVLRVSRVDYEAALASSPETLAARVRAWGTAPVQPQLELLADQIRALARRLDKPVPQVHVEGGEVRVDRARLAPLWLALAHATRNIVAHAVQPEAIREACGKPARTQVTLTSRVTSRAVELEIRDDGPGIDWGHIDQRARALGVAQGHDAVFAPGVSTRTHAEISEHAGRGMGLGAIRATCERLGGTVTVESEAGTGTTLCCVIPHGESSCHAS
jgi:two-component system chemotaxis sensor kinase CheA